ncbi:Uncharacterized protein Rs2_12606 [Raphanus sativus]|nr:Uncharacterized protein Rs2_12606 [Raphanus sativus]
MVHSSLSPHAPKKENASRRLGVINNHLTSLSHGNNGYCAVRCAYHFFFPSKLIYKIRDQTKVQGLQLKQRHFSNEHKTGQIPVKIQAIKLPSHLRTQVNYLEEPTFIHEEFKQLLRIDPSRSATYD